MYHPSQSPASGSNISQAEFGYQPANLTIITSHADKPHVILIWDPQLICQVIPIIKFAG